MTCKRSFMSLDQRVVEGLVSEYPVKGCFPSSYTLPSHWACHQNGSPQGGEFADETCSRSERVEISLSCCSSGSHSVFHWTAETHSVFTHLKSAVPSLLQSASPQQSVAKKRGSQRILSNLGREACQSESHYPRSFRSQF